MSDRLSPILVKELRQGIRSRLFTGSFLLVQALLFLFGLSFVLSDSLQKDATAGSAFFWMMLALPLVVLVPASASQAVEREVSGRTLELLLLTRLSSYRIVFGKWASVVLQTSLLLVSALPYVILRYFLGGIDVVGELQTMGGLLLGSGLLAGVAMGFWSLNVPRLAKWAAVLLLIWMAPFLILMAASPHGTFSSPPGLGSLAWIYGTIVMLMMIEAAAARIGPPSENHWTRVRALALLSFGIAFLYDGMAAVVAAAAAIGISLPAMIASMSQNGRPLRRLHEPFHRGSALRRLALFPFSPSWPGGVAFSALMILLAPLLPALRGDIGPVAWIAVATTLLFPVALVRGAFAGSRPLLLYIVILVLSSFPIYVYAFAQSAETSSLSVFLQSVSGFFAPLALVVELAHPDGYTGAAPARAILLIVTATSALVILLAARREWTRIASLFSLGPVGGEAER